MLAIEQRVEDLERRLATLEARGGMVRRTPPTPVAPAPAPPAASARRLPDLEDLLGGRVLAWVGGVAVLVGLVLLLVMAVSRGWIGEEARTLIAGVASLVMLAVGRRLFTSRGRTDAALAATAAGIAGLDATLIVATNVYGLIPVVAGVSGAFAVGALAAALAIRWDAPGLAALGILGGLLSPALVGASFGSAHTLGFLFTGYGAAVAACLARRWSWLALPAFLIVSVQWAAWVFGTDRDPVTQLPVVVAFGVLAWIAAVGYELRTRSDKVPPAAHALLALNALATSLAGWLVLEGFHTDSDRAGQVWLASVAAAHLTLGFARSRYPRLSHQLSLVLLGIGIVIADVALASAVSGVALPLAWVAGAVGFAALSKTARRGTDDESFAVIGLGGHVAIALLHALVVDAPPSLLSDSSGSGTALAALAAVAAGCLLTGRMIETHPRLARGLDVLGLATTAYLGAIAFGGTTLALAWAGEAAALALLARRHDLRDARPVAMAAACAFATGAVAVLVAGPLPLDALAHGLSAPSQAAIAGAVTVAAIVLCARLPLPRHQVRLAWTAAITLALFVASALVVTPFDSQDGQTALSAFWGLAGVTSVTVGLLRDLRPVRVAGLALLALAIAKVFVIDLSSLDSLARVVSFLVLGCLLLAGAYAWQRIRPRVTPDLRAMPEALR